jgi:DNA topoisomerase-3
MTVGLLTEKPSAARHFAAALGGARGTYSGEQYVIAHARGHLYEYADPSKMVDPSLEGKYARWDLSNLPWNLDDLDWHLRTIAGAGAVAQEVKKRLSSCDEIVIATDVDPSGEGGAIAVNALLQLGLDRKRISRMYFTDEAPKSLRKAFVNRKVIADLMQFDEYRKARYRSQFDLASMQFTRIATQLARSSGQRLVLRQGRLKSAMVKLVGDQLKAYNDYVKRPFFQNRFRDENGVMYINPEEPTFDSQAAVPQRYTRSAVVLDSKANKQTAPPKLLDLAALSSMLVDKGLKAQQVLKTYQAMYEAQVVSYPRTEDKTITPEQFKELLPHVDKIAALVGVDLKHLTHRQPRGTHVKAQGAHGANRPGLKVPGSLAELKKFGPGADLIYQTLARNYLAMLAEDYVYEQQKGHVEKYPDFKGIANVPVSAGWKAVFDPGADATSSTTGASKGAAGDKDAAPDETDENENSRGLGTRAVPFVFEGANKRPEHPSMRWLMKQLEKRDVGTGATRTSTYSEVTNERSKYPLLVEKGRRLTLALAGEMSWLLLPGTHIGDLSLTEKVYADMREVADGTADPDRLLARVADWVRADIQTMTRNAASMRSTLGLSEVSVERAEGTWDTAPGGPRKIAFKKTCSGHTFTDPEVAALLRGETITFAAVSAKTRRPFQVSGGLAVQDYQGRKYVGFQPQRPDGPTQWCGHVFTVGEKARLKAGEKVVRDDWVSNAGKRFACAVTWDDSKKQVVPEFGDDDEPPRSWCGVTLTDQQRADLEAGKPIEGKGFTSKKGKKFDCMLEWKDEGGKKKLVPSFG